MKKLVKNFAFEDLSDFIRSQPDDRPLNMNQPFGHSDCGCILVHFGRKISHRKIEMVGYRGITDDRNQNYNGDEQTHNFISQMIDKKPVNYKQVKNWLNKFVDKME